MQRGPARRTPRALGTSRHRAGRRRQAVRRQKDIVAAVEQVDLTIGEGEFFSLLGPSRLRQDHDAADDRRLRGADRAARSCSTATTCVGAAEPSRRQHGVPELRAVPAHDGLRERRLRAASARASARPRSGAAGQRDARPGRARPGTTDRRPRELSGGQQQRVALARALVNRPRALLLDEPLGALDLKLRQAMQIELKRIQREVGITFVFVTHDQNEALTMSRPARGHERRPDRAARHAARGLRAAGDPVRGRLHRHVQPRAPARSSDRRRRRGPGDARPTSRSSYRCGAPVPVGQPLAAHRAPGEDRARSTAPNLRLCALRGRVTEVVYLGTSTHYAVTTATARTWSSSCRTPPTPAIAPQRGDEVWLSLAAGALASPRSSMPNEPPERGPAMTSDPDARARSDMLRGDDPAAATRGMPAAGSAPSACLRGAAARARSRRRLGRRRPSRSRRSGPARSRPASSTSPTGRSTSTSARARATTRRSTCSPSRPASRSTTARSSRTTTRSSRRSQPRWPPGRTPATTYGHHQRDRPRQAARARLPGPARPADAELRRRTPAPPCKDPSYDRGNVYTMAWQSGITGIGYNPKQVAEEITSWDDLLDPAFKGKIGMFADNEDLPTPAWCAIGVNPETTDARRLEEGRRLAEQAAQPLVRKYYDQDYIDAAAQGRHLGLDGLVRRHLPGAAPGAHGPASSWCPKEGARDLDRQHVHPGARSRTRSTR